MEETDVEVRPEFLQSALLDCRVKFMKLKKYFSDDAWALLIPTGQWHFLQLKVFRAINLPSVQLQSGYEYCYLAKDDTGFFKDQKFVGASLCSTKNSKNTQSTTEQSVTYRAQMSVGE